MKLPLVKFKRGAYITVEKKHEGDHFYIIRKGKVNSFSSITTEFESLKKLLGPGDFFGVVSSMTGHPRLSSSYALEDTDLIMVRKQQFGYLLQQTTPLAMKIIRSFSNELRIYDEELTNRTFKDKNEKESSIDSLHNNAEFYFKKNDFQSAAYIYMQYLKNYPLGEMADNAIGKLTEIKKKNPELRQELGELVFQGVNREFKKKQILVSEFEPGYEMFIIDKGRVAISKVIGKKEIILAVLKEGDIFGEMALLNNEPRSASAFALENTVCKAVNVKNFESIIKNNVKLAINIISLISERLWTIYKQLDNFYFSEKKARVYDTLLTQIYKKRVPIVSNANYQFDFGKSEITHMLGFDSESMEETMKQIKKDNIVFLSDEGRFYCENLINLEKEVNFSRKMEQRKRKIISSREKTGVR